MHQHPDEEVITLSQLKDNTPISCLLQEMGGKKPNNRKAKKGKGVLLVPDKPCESLTSDDIIQIDEAEADEWMTATADSPYRVIQVEDVIRFLQSQNAQQADAAQDDGSSEDSTEVRHAVATIAIADQNIGVVMNEEPSDAVLVMDIAPDEREFLDEQVQAEVSPPCENHRGIATVEMPRFEPGAASEVLCNEDPNYQWIKATQVRPSDEGLARRAATRPDRRTSICERSQLRPSDPSPKANGEWIIVIDEEEKRLADDWVNRAADDQRSKPVVPANDSSAPIINIMESTDPTDNDASIESSASMLDNGAANDGPQGKSQPIREEPERSYTPPLPQAAVLPATVEIEPAGLRSEVHVVQPYVAVQREAAEQPESYRIPKIPPKKEEPRPAALSVASRQPSQKKKAKCFICDSKAHNGPSGCTDWKSMKISDRALALRVRRRCESCLKNRAAHAQTPCAGRECPNCPGQKHNTWLCPVMEGYIQKRKDEAEAVNRPPVSPPKRWSPRRSPPRRPSPRRTSPRRPSTRRASPRRASPRNRSPRRSPPRRSSSYSTERRWMDRHDERYDDQRERDRPAYRDYNDDRHNRRQSRDRYYDKDRR